MKSLNLILISLLFIFTSCKDKSSVFVEVEEVPKTDQIVTPVSEDKCDSGTKFGGIKTIADITDSSAIVSWDRDDKSIGYSLFMISEGGLKVVGHIGVNDNSFQINNLSESSSYSFILKTINKEGEYDCNENKKSFDTTEKQTFLSCNEINEYYKGAKSSGVYEIDTDLDGVREPFEVYCDMSNNNGGWTRVFSHNTVSGFFSDDLEAKELNISDVTNDKYSILSKLSEFMREGKYEFWLYYPEHDGVDGGNIWTQISNPVTDLISGYVSIREDYTDMYWGGLEKSSYSGTLIDGSVGSGWWYYAIGANRKWPGDGVIPGPLRNSGIHEVQLFIR